MSKPRTYTEAAEKSMAYHLFEPIAAAFFAELQAERAVRAELLEACKAQHKALDILLAMLAERDTSFFPSKSAAWPAVLQGIAAIGKAEPSPLDSQGSHAD